MKLNTRIAPSPTGNMHIGTARTAYLNWLVAKNTGGNFYLRIDDTDTKRSKDEFVDTIKDSMKWLGLDYSGDIRYQNDHDRYMIYASDLIAKGAATIKDGAIIVEGLQGSSIPKHWYDEVVGEVKTSDQDLQSLVDFVIIKSDGSPTYNFATVVDDFEMGVNCIIRGVDHISNTVKQQYIYNLLGFSPVKPAYYHLGLLLGEDGKKISKRAGALSVTEYREEGYSSDALLNYVLRMGWSPKQDNKENSIIGREKAIQMVMNEGNFRAAPSRLDPNKLKWYNKKYKAK
jgi:glutamyl-tRNA synthetase